MTLTREKKFYKQKGYVLFLWAAFPFHPEKPGFKLTILSRNLQLGVFSSSISPQGKIKILSTPGAFLFYYRTKVKQYLLGNLCRDKKTVKPPGKCIQQPVCQERGLQTSSFLLQTGILELQSTHDYVDLFSYNVIISTEPQVGDNSLLLFITWRDYFWVKALRIQIYQERTACVMNFLFSSYLDTKPPCCLLLLPS